MPDLQIWMSCSNKLDFILDLLRIISLLNYNNCKSFQMLRVRSNRKRSKVIGMSSDLFGNVRKSSENCRKSLEVAWMFLEIPVMTRQNSHAFDSEKVDRDTISIN